MEERLQAILRLALRYSASKIYLSNAKGQSQIEMCVDDIFAKVKGRREDWELPYYMKHLLGLDIYNGALQSKSFDYELDGVSRHLKYTCVRLGDNEFGIIDLFSL